MEGSGEVEPARWCVVTPTYQAAMACGSPVFTRPALRHYRQAALRRAARHPIRTVRGAALAGSTRAALALQLWRETGEWFAIRELDIDGRATVPVQRVLATRMRATQPALDRSHVTGLVIAQDEERLIPRTLENLRPWVGQTIVVDGGSRDATVAVARAAGSVVLEHPFRADFALQRNVGLEQIRTPWVLMLDCDETLPATLAQAMLDAAGPSDVDAIYVPRLNLVGDDPEPTRFPDLQPRLFRRHLRYHGKVHEVVRPRSAVFFPVNGPQIGHHKSPLRHFENSLGYNAIDARQSRPDVAAWTEREVARLRESGSAGGGDPARS